MLIKMLSQIFNTDSNRKLKYMQKIVDKINEMESNFQKMSDVVLKKQTEKFKILLNKGYRLDDLLPQAFATVREASKRVFGMRHFDVQILGGIVLNKRCIAEMRTGEGKTLTATLPSYLHALKGKGVHIVTMNDYLAERDAKKNKPLFNFLGLTVGINISGMSIVLKRKSYLSDITYGTNNEYGFDYLRDNMVFNSSDKVQRSLYYALIDEVDSILIDEARTPLIISGPSEDNSIVYMKINSIISQFILQDTTDINNISGNGDYYIDRKQKQVFFTEKGLIKIENLLVHYKIINDSNSLYSVNNIALMNHFIVALRANILFHKDVDYIVKDRKVLLIDEHTGRIMYGRRLSDGLHQAIEAKEGVDINNENQTLASITFQNYFRLYKKISGMTGTAITESFEFRSIYNLDTIVIPTNCPMVRKDLSDVVFMTEQEKINSVVNDIKKCVLKKQPILVGTASIEKSEVISKKLTQLNIKHNVLNAKFHEKEAKIISEAGKLGAVTIATNMAGRGTDIVLGGSIDDKVYNNFNVDSNQFHVLKKRWIKKHKTVLSVGGLHVIGTERHESRRIDNQLRGRSGRQGDLGSSRFYLSMEDSLMKMFLSDRILSMIKKFNIKPGTEITHPFITKSIAHAQKKIENYNFDIRRQLLEYDDVINEQRRVIFIERNTIINTIDISSTIKYILKDILNVIIDSYKFNKNFKKNCYLLDLEKHINRDFNVKLVYSRYLFNKDVLYSNKINDLIIKQIRLNYSKKENLIGFDNMRKLERSVMLHTLDLFWQEHLLMMDNLRQGIHLRSYARKDPRQEYKKEAFNLFSSMLAYLKYEVSVILSSLNINKLSKENTTGDSLYNFKNWQQVI
ncbi:preprotein translocase subunit SecA [Buchnera aphidicola (Formosaphis micheliae)]|uniref:preprotein translocase subunit SecA n=1 Tax=Buchnera aphidicola TaxID=9 RepID=UPI0031CC9DD2